MKKELGINRISPSMLVMYENCPKAFYYIVWLGLKLPTPKMHLLFGTAIHAAIDHIYELQPKWAESSVDGALLILKTKFLEHHVDDKEYTPIQRTEKYLEMLNDGYEMLKQFWAQKEILWAKGVQPSKMELPIKMGLWNPETKDPLEIPMSCRLDGETEDSNIIEFKTSSAPYDEFETHLSNQSRSYVWVQFCRTGKIPDVHYVVLRKKIKKNKIQHLPLKYDMGDILAFDSKVRSILERIRNREFDRGKNCQAYCDHRKIELLLNKKKQHEIS